MGLHKLSDVIRAKHDPSSDPNRRQTVGVTRCESGESEHRPGADTEDVGHGSHWKQGLEDSGRGAHDHLSGWIAHDGHRRRSDHTSAGGSSGSASRLRVSVGGTSPASAASSHLSRYRRTTRVGTPASLANSCIVHCPAPTARAMSNAVRHSPSLKLRPKRTASSKTASSRRRAVMPSPSGTSRPRWRSTAHGVGRTPRSTRGGGDACIRAGGLPTGTPRSGVPSPQACSRSGWA
jgi:hypothetical protein